MAVTQPPGYTPPPPKPQRGIRDTFFNLMDDFVTWVTEKVPTEIAALAANVYANAADAFGSATAAATSASKAKTSEDNAALSASAAAVTTGATLWVSGQSVAQDAAKISPLDRQTYRRKTAAGSGTVDPSLDSTNYTLISVGQSATTLIATATVGSPVANIDFLNLFTDLYAKYVIEIVGLTPSSAGELALRVGVGGTPVSSDYINGGSLMAYATLSGFTAGPNASTLTVDVRGARSSGSLTSISMKGIISTGSASTFETGFKSTSVVSGFRLFNVNGVSFTAGTVSVYGVRA